MKLERTMGDKVVAGVCGGLAKAFGLSATGIRWAFVFLVLFAGLSVLVYFIAWFLMPSDGEYRT